MRASDEVPSKAGTVRLVNANPGLSLKCKAGGVLLVAYRHRPFLIGKAKQAMCCMAGFVPVET